MHAWFEIREKLKETLNVLFSVETFFLIFYALGDSWQKVFFYEDALRFRVDLLILMIDI